MSRDEMSQRVIERIVRTGPGDGIGDGLYRESRTLTFNLYERADGTVAGTLADSRDPLGSMVRVRYDDRRAACKAAGWCQMRRVVTLNGQRMRAPEDWGVALDPLTGGAL